MCYHRRTIHSCHHTTLGAVISRCAHRPTPTPKAPNPQCTFQWSRAIFTIRSAAKCRRCIKLDCLLTSISTLTTTASLRLEKVSETCTLRATARNKGELICQRPLAYYDTEAVRKGRTFGRRRSTISNLRDDDCASDASGESETAGSESSMSSSGSVRSFGETASNLSTLSEGDDINKLEDLEYIPLPTVGVRVF